MTLKAHGRFFRDGEDRSSLAEAEEDRAAAKDDWNSGRQKKF